MLWNRGEGTVQEGCSIVYLEEGYLGGGSEAADVEGGGGKWVGAMFCLFIWVKSLNIEEGRGKLD